MLKRIFVVAVALLALTGGPLATQRALAGPVADLTAMTNADRAAHRLRALSTAGDLQSLAQRRADEMARSGRLAHTTGLGTKLSGWKRLGENVGRGPSLRDIQTAFMNSPSHRENIVDPGFTQLGVGVTYDGREYLYVAVIFREPSGAAAAAPAPRPSTTPTSRAAAAPKPRPTTTTRPPASTTTQPPSTTTTTLPPPPPPAPVEEIAAPVEPPPPPPAPAPTTTTTARPIFSDRDFLAQNFSDRTVPAMSTSPLPSPEGRSPVPIVVAALMAATMGVAVGRVWGATAQRVAAQTGGGSPNQV